MNSKEIFTLALNLSEPWFIEDIEMGISDKTILGRIDIYIDFKRGFKFKDELGNETAAYDTVDRKWRHLNFFQHECYIHARVPRIKTKGEGGISTVQVPWARKGSSFTLLFEALSMLLIESEMPVKKAAKLMGVYDNRLWRAFSYWVTKAFKADDQRGISSIGIDETSTKKGHNYITIAVDMKEKRVIYATLGKDSSCIEKLKNHLSEKGCSNEQINQVSIDMSPAYISGITNNFPNAQITFDKFHVSKIINEAMDKVRKAERKEIEELKGHKYLFLKDDKNLNKEQIENKHYFLSSYPTLGDAYRLKELFNDFWNIKSKEEASGYLSYWCDIVEESTIKPFIKVVNTIKEHWAGIINYFDSKLNNGILEGINSKIQLAKKRARGFRNINNFINMIYFIAGKLKMVYPLYME
jgi:transposase